MKIFTRLIIFVFTCALGVCSVFIFQHYQRSNNDKPLTPFKTGFELKPPSRALAGNLSLREGDVSLITREGKEITDVKINTEIVDGDQVKTGDGAKAILIFPDVELQLDEKTHIECTNLISEHLIIKHLSGSAVYELKKSNALSIRFEKSLFLLEEGTAEVSLRDARPDIIVTEGRGKYAEVDENNNTQVTTIAPSEK